MKARALRIGMIGLFAAASMFISGPANAAPTSMAASPDSVIQTATVNAYSSESPSHAHGKLSITWNSNGSWDYEYWNYDTSADGAGPIINVEECLESNATGQCEEDIYNHNTTGGANSHSYANGTVPASDLKWIIVYECNGGNHDSPLHCGKIQPAHNPN